MEKIVLTASKSLPGLFSGKINKFSITLFILNLFCINVFAQWSNNPSVNNPVCNYDGSQMDMQMVSDDAGGAILTWVDTRNSYQDIYAQHIDAYGNLLWNSDGVAICNAALDQFKPRIISDGAGGAIIAWYDNRVENDWNIYAQRINANGEVQWAIDGVPVCTAMGNQSAQQLLAINGGEAIIVWTDGRNGGPNADIYAQRMNANGVAQWTSNGVAVCTASNAQSSPQLVTDGNSGAIITWGDYRGEWSDIYAQRITSAGVISWAYDGLPICTANYHQDTPKIISGINGAIICWQDNRNGNLDVYAQKISYTTGDIQWTTNGVSVCTAPGLQAFNQMIPDNAGGVYITWEDRRSNSDIYAQKLNNLGVPQWTTDGIAVCASAPVQKDPQLCLNNSGNVIITWQDDYTDIYAQAVSPTGTTLWETDGVIVCNAEYSQLTPQLVLSGGTNTVIIAWQDSRNGSYDIYASKLFGDGLLPVQSFPSSSVKVYPNPVNEVLNIQKPENLSFDEIKITDIAGKTIMEVSGASNQINVEQLKQGMYIVMMKSDKGNYVSEIIKN